MHYSLLLGRREKLPSKVLALERSASLAGSLLFGIDGCKIVRLRL